MQHIRQYLRDRMEYDCYFYATVRICNNDFPLAGKRIRGVHSHCYGPRPAKARKIDPDAVIKLKKNLQEINP